MNYWLLKSEPDSYSIDDLKRDRKTAWTGIRNYQARNFLQQMSVGDLCLFYHSGKDAAVVGIAKVVKNPYPDPLQFEKSNYHFDAKATEEKPIWYCVDISFEDKLKQQVSLTEIKNDPTLEGMAVRTKGRLSVQPVSEKHFKYIGGLS